MALYVMLGSCDTEPKLHSTAGVGDAAPEPSSVLLDAGEVDSGVTGTGAGVAHDSGAPKYRDLPSEPTLSTGLGPEVIGLFAVPDKPGAGPCLSEPALGALLPANWSPPYFEWIAPAGLNVFELRLKAPNQEHDYVAYTSAWNAEVSRAIWQSLAPHVTSSTLQISLRGARLEQGVLAAGPFLGALGVINVAPVEAAGAIVYWTTSNGTALKGFSVGDPEAKLVFKPTAQPESPYKCVGCHTSSPDGLTTFISASASASGGPFVVDTFLTDPGGKQPAAGMGITPYAKGLLGRVNQTLPATSPAHYSATDSVVVTVLRSNDTSNKYELVWTDLHANVAGWGIIARRGDARQAGVPTFSHDGKSLAYVSSDGVSDGYTGYTNSEPSDIYVVPYNDRAGGDAAPLQGASTSEYNEVYPSYAPGDSLVAFTRTSLGKSYSVPSAEIFLVPRAGGAAVRISANDAPACTGLRSPGVTNSWARWSPTSTTHKGLTYYWLTFSSRRRKGDRTTPAPQLYVAGVVVDQAGNIVTYPAVYVRSQVDTEANHTPAWDVFELLAI